MDDYQNIILFDGVCNLCNRTVVFIIKRDPGGKFRFAPIQSEAGKKYIGNINFPGEGLQTIIYIRGNKYYTRSEAVLRILKDIGGLWKIFFGLMILPGFIRDFIYNTIAKTRYRIFGKFDTCMVPSQELKERFLE